MPVLCVQKIANDSRSVRLCGAGFYVSEASAANATENEVDIGVEGMAHTPRTAFNLLSSVCPSLPAAAGAPLSKTPGLVSRRTGAGDDQLLLKPTGDPPDVRSDPPIDKCGRVVLEVGLLFPPAIVPR